MRHDETMSESHLYKHLRLFHGAESAGRNVRRFRPVRPVDISQIAMNMNGKNIRSLFVRAFGPTISDMLRRLRRIGVIAAAETAPEITIRCDPSVLIAELKIPDDMVTPMFTIAHGFDACCFSSASAVYTDGIMQKIVINSIVYEFDRYISQGGYGQVYEIKARHPSLRNMACKIVPNSGSEASLEIAIHKQLKHENIVELCYSFQDNLSAVLVMDVCPQSLADFVERKEFVEYDECRHLMRQLLYAISYLHRNNFIHRDLKLSNVLLSQNQQVKLCDFGIAISSDAQASELRLNVGSVPFTSPEVIGRRGAKFASDVWAIGVIFYRLIKGCRPFDSPGEAVNASVVYSRIREARYELSPHDEPHFVQFIKAVFQLDEEMRPTAENCLDMQIFKGRTQWAKARLDFSTPQFA